MYLRTSKYKGLKAGSRPSPSQPATRPTLLSSHSETAGETYRSCQPQLATEKSPSAEEIICFAVRDLQTTEIIDGFGLLQECENRAVGEEYGTAA